MKFFTVLKITALAAAMPVLLFTKSNRGIIPKPAPDIYLPVNPGFYSYKWNLPYHYEGFRCRNDIHDTLICINWSCCCSYYCEWPCCFSCGIISIDSPAVNSKIDSAYKFSSDTSIAQLVKIQSIKDSARDKTLKYVIKGDSSAGNEEKYSTFNEAVNALHAHGICGPVSFNVAYGVYYEAEDLDSITNDSIPEFKNISIKNEPQLPSKSALASSDQSEISAKAFPNPTHGQFNISFSSSLSDNFSIQIFDITGNMAYEKQIEYFNGYYTQVVDLSGKPKGIYFLQISQGDKTLTKKLVLD